MEKHVNLAEESNAKKEELRKKQNLLDTRARLNQKQYSK